MGTKRYEIKTIFEYGEQNCGLGMLPASMEKFLEEVKTNFLTKGCEVFLNDLEKNETIAVWRNVQDTEVDELNEVLYSIAKGD